MFGTAKRQCYDYTKKERTKGHHNAEAKRQRVRVGPPTTHKPGQGQGRVEGVGTNFVLVCRPFRHFRSTL